MSSSRRSSEPQRKKPPIRLPAGALARALRAARGGAFAAVAFGALPASLEAQEANGRPRVFFDCDGPDCNFQYYRTEIDWVDWVNVREVSDIHLIISSVGTGAGGREYLLDFIGRGAAEGYDDEMVLQSLPTDTDRERLDRMTHALSIGFARFAAVQGYGELATVEGRPGGAADPSARVVAPQEVDDPWNLWVFRINARGNLNGESLSKRENLFGSFNASRVTPTWKINLSTNVNFQGQEYELEDSTLTDNRYDWGVRPYVVYSFSEHWSLGVRAEVARIVRFNQALRWEVTPAIEYSVFPYEEATRRALTVSYRMGPAYREYLEETVYLQSEETRWEHSLEVDFSQRQPWGEAGASVSASQFLFLPSDPLYEEGLYNVSLRGDIEFRVIRGLNLQLDGNIEWVQDQIYLSADGVTDEEALLRLQQQETDFQYGVSIGLSFQFGSIFNNVVNNRFNRAQGFGGRFF